jgi:quinoprotein dehydrogenase-associated probable ABC transporter substrate-binding protein
MRVESLREWWCRRYLAVGILAGLWVLNAVANAQENPPVDTQEPAAGSFSGSLKVCADPYMLPFSNKEEQGFENRIAELLAEKLGANGVEYTWFPQRLGFIRNTLRAQTEDGGYKCDLVINVPDGFELAATTEPYYRSTYMLAYVRGRGLDEVTSPEMLGELAARGRTIRFGLPDQGPAQFWVTVYGQKLKIVPYQGQPGDPKVNPGEVLLRELVLGNIDATIVWGPTAGYYARKFKEEEEVEFVLLPLRDEPEKHGGLRFEFNFAMAVRHGEREWRDTVNRLIRENQEGINAILEEYGVPLLPVKQTAARREDDDDD